MLFRKRKRSKKTEKEIRREAKPSFKNVLTAIFATISAAFLLLMAGLSLSGTAMAFAACMPLFIVFSPVLVPAGITTTVLATGLLAGGNSCATGLKIFMWILKKIIGKQLPKIPGLNNTATARLAAKGGKAPKGKKTRGGDMGKFDE